MPLEIGSWLPLDLGGRAQPWAGPGYSYHPQRILLMMMMMMAMMMMMVKMMMVMMMIGMGHVCV